MGKMSRRQFLKLLAVGLGGLGLIFNKYILGPLSGAAEALNDKLYLPFIARHEQQAPTATQTATATSTPTETPTPTVASSPQPSVTPSGIGPRVVHVHSVNATNWDGSTTDYWNYVNQDVVNTMVDQGMMALTGQATAAAAWRVLLPNYQVGQGIAIKVSFNNTFYCDDVTGKIDSIIHPINAIINGLKLIGVREEDIWIYDAIRSIPEHFVNGCIFNNIKYYDNGCHLLAGFTGDDVSSIVTFNPPEGVPVPTGEYITDVLVRAKYLINMPILKYHNLMGVSMAFKNHFGTINLPGQLHALVGINEPYYTSNYSAFVDLYNNPNIVDKTIITICDGIFGAQGHSIGPQKWKTFGNQVPKSLFLGTDPVAMDCVLCDFVDAEITLTDATYDYLRLANEDGLGIFERGDPWGSGYANIDYQKIEIG